MYTAATIEMAVAVPQGMMTRGMITKFSRTNLYISSGSCSHGCTARKHCN